MFVLKRLFVCLVVTSLLFTACEKDATVTELTPSTTETSTTTPSNTTTANEAANFRALAAAARVSHNGGTFLSEEDNPCGCYDVFNEVDFEASDREIEAAVNAIIDALPEEELTRLFKPVCTDEGKIYESACIADCKGITNYHICSEEELEDYFFDDFKIEDLDEISFPFEFDLPDGSIVIVNNEEELFAALDQWYEEYEGDYDDWEGFGKCFEIVYPIQLSFPDATIMDVNSDDELYTALDTWFKANPESEEEPLPVFPINVILKDGTTKSIDSEEGIEELEKDCYGDYGDWEGEWEEDEWEDFEECYSIVYPIQVTNPDGMVQTYNSDEELYTGLDDWYTANPDSDEDPMPVYPVEVLLEDGTTQTINNDEEGEALEESCYGEFDEDICFELVFPITLTPTDSTTIEVNDEDELENALEIIFKDVEDIDDIDEAAIIAVFTSFDIQFDDGTIATINTIDDLEAAIFKCFGFGLQEAGSVKDLLLDNNSTNNSFLSNRKSK